MSLTFLPVSEVFGPTWQGEGPHAGVRTGFVRLGLCNLSCEWCDTPYTWDRSRFDLAKEAPLWAVAQVHDRLEGLGVEVVCLSGGEPLIHHRKLADLLVPPWVWHAETNGTIPPPPYWAGRVAHTSVSPKINTRDPEHRRIRPHVLAQWNRLAAKGRACFKFVAAEESDLDAVEKLCAQVDIHPRDVWIMPQGITTPELLERHARLAPHIEARGWQTTTRLHVLLYGQERAR